MVTIKVRQNGSLLVEGEDVKLVDWNGNEYYLVKKPFALCRCGQSQRKPFCDSAHKLCNFQASEAAPGPNVPPADAPPASNTPPTS
jgi:CDGSH-type Zn-finger protein